MSGRQLKILLAEGSSISARHALFTLGRRHLVDVVDPGRWRICRFSRLVRRWYRCPSFSQQPTAYINFLLDRLRAEPYDVLLPTYEEVYLISRFRDTLSRHVGIACPPFEALTRLQSKSQFMRLLDELNLPHPPTVFVRCYDELIQHRDFPCYIKLPFGVAGYGVRRVENVAQLEAVATEFQREGWLDDHRELIIQQEAQGVESSVVALYQDGRLVACPSFEETTWGMPIVRTSALHEQVVQHARRIGEALQLHGVVCYSYFFDPQTGRPQYIECNPRTGETLSAWLSGVNICEQLARISTGETVETCIEMQPGVRSHCGFIVLLALARQGANRRQLLAELIQSWRRTGKYTGSQSELARPRDDWMSLLPTTAICSLLVAAPRTAELLVKNNVDHFSMSDQAAHEIQNLSLSGSADHDLPQRGNGHVAESQTS